MALLELIMPTLITHQCFIKIKRKIKIIGRMRRILSMVVGLKRSRLALAPQPSFQSVLIISNEQLLYSVRSQSQL